MVVRQYKAKGPLTSLLLPIVALDDAVGLIVFAVLFGISKAITSSVADFSAIVINPLIEIVGSVFSIPIQTLSPAVAFPEGMQRINHFLLIRG